MELNDTDLIDRYCRGTLGPEERTEVEIRMKEDPAFREEMELHKDLLGGMNLHFNQELKSKLHHIDQQGQGGGSDQAKGRSLGSWWLVAASLAFFLLLGYWYFASQSSPEKLYQAYYQPYPNIIHPVERSGAQAQDGLSQAMGAYEQGNYQEAIARFEQYGDELGPSYRFYQALSYLESSEPEQALPLLEEVEKSADETFYLPALWYQGMVHLSTGSTAEAGMALQKVVDTGDSAYSTQAKEILKALE